MPVISNEQDSPTFPSRVANYRVGFGSSCPFAEPKNQKTKAYYIQPRLAAAGYEKENKIKIARTLIHQDFLLSSRSVIEVLL